MAGDKPAVNSEFPFHLTCMFHRENQMQTQEDSSNFTQNEPKRAWESNRYSIKNKHLKAFFLAPHVDQTRQMHTRAHAESKMNMNIKIRGRHKVKKNLLKNP